MSGPAEDRLTVAVTGLNANDNPGAGVGVIRALREGYADKVRIIGLAYEPLEPGIYIDGLVDRVYQIPYPAAGAQALKSRILTIHQQESLNVIIPNFDAELPNFIQLADELRLAGINTFLPSAVQLKARDKATLENFGAERGFNVPVSVAVNNTDELTQALDKFSYPLMMKGKLYEAYYADSEEEAKRAFHKVMARWGAPVILQQYITGTEINVAGLSDKTGKLISAVAMRKQYITDKGKAWAGITIKDQTLIDLAAGFASDGNWKGTFELELIRDAEGKTYLLEINPRFPAWIYLACAAGQNQPAMLVEMATGKKARQSNDYTAGKMFVRYAWDNVIDVSAFQQFSSFGQIYND